MLVSRWQIRWVTLSWPSGECKHPAVRVADQSTAGESVLSSFLVFFFLRRFVGAALQNNSRLFTTRTMCQFTRIDLQFRKKQLKKRQSNPSSSLKVVGTLGMRLKAACRIHGLIVEENACTDQISNGRWKIYRFQKMRDCLMNPRELFFFPPFTFLWRVRRHLARRFRSRSLNVPSRLHCNAWRELLSSQVSITTARC